MAEEMKLSIEEVTKRGAGFYLAKSVINYKRPISGLQKVFISTFVKEILEDKILIVPFKILSENKQVLFSDGELQFVDGGHGN